MLMGCWQPVSALVGHALGEEGVSAGSPQWCCAGGRQVADPLFRVDRAGVSRGPRLALGVRTPGPDPWSRPDGGVVRGDHPVAGRPGWVGHRR
jgi:hypothetical protein